jgi:hypothetical protein
MKPIKNKLLETLPVEKGEIKKLIDYIEDERNFGYNLRRYINVVEYSGDRFSEPFIKLVYEILIEWGMNKLGAKLNDRKSFKDSIIENEEAIEAIQKLQGHKLETIDSFTTIEPEIRTLFENLKLVYGDRPKLVTFAKTMHFFVPNLLMPIDRKYTLSFVYDTQHPTVPTNDEEQIQIYKAIFEETREYYSRILTKEDYLTEGWSRNIPKLIDGLIIAYIKTNDVKLTNKDSDKKSIAAFSRGSKSDLIRTILKENPHLSNTEVGHKVVKMGGGKFKTCYYSEVASVRKQLEN